jgi:type IV secretory pathway VirB10-like protein
MTGDPAQDFYEPPIRPYRPVRVQAMPVVVILIMLVGTLVGGYFLAKKAGWLEPAQFAKATWDGDGAGIKSKIAYPAEVHPALAANGRDPMDELKRWLEQEFSGIKARLTALENQPKPKPAAPTAPVKQPEAKAQPKPHRPMLFISNKADRDAPDADTYLLAPGSTKVPCVVETSMNSEIESNFTAKVRTNIYDTETGGRLLIPQGSTVLGEYHSASLVFGNERLPSMSLSVALPDGRSVDLGNAPVMNQAGMAGLVSRVDQHWWRLIGATLVLGALRGGQQAVYTVVSPGDTAGAVASGLGSAVGQVGQQKIGRALDTRPTISVDAGTLCQVLLTKPLKLAAYAQQP